jgi:intracellular sulfur oxidation DsrE/DsrF family protein
MMSRTFTAGVIAAAALVALAIPVTAADAPRPHRVAIQIDQSDPAVVGMALNNASHVIEHYRAKGEDVDVEIVAYGPGLNILRADTSTVKDRLDQLVQLAAPGRLKFAACNNTKEAMEKREGHPIALVPQATLVPAGVVELMELQEAGWSYVRP